MRCLLNPLSAATRHSVGQTVAVLGHSETFGLRPRLHGGNGRW